jgi:hypothetical protein
VIRALETDVTFGVYHAVSWPSRRRWNLDATVSELGYEPDRGGPWTADGDAEAGLGHLSTCMPGGEDGVPTNSADSAGPSR